MSKQNGISDSLMASADAAIRTVKAKTLSSLASIAAMTLRAHNAHEIKGDDKTQSSITDVSRAWHLAIGIA